LADGRIEDERQVMLRDEIRCHNVRSVSFRPKGEILCPESIAITYTY
jgi:hypothetical protein